MSKFVLLQNTQANTTSGTTVSSQAISFSNTTLGSTLIVIVEARTGSSNPSLSLSDNLLSTYTSIAGTGLNIGSQGRHDWFMITPSPAGINSITVTPSINSWIGIQLYELGGLSANPIITVTQNATTSTGPATGTIVGAAVGDYILGAVGAHTGSFGSSANFTMSAEMDSTTAPVTGLRTGRRGPILTNATLNWSTTTSGSNVPWVVTLVSFTPLNSYSNDYLAVSSGDGMSVTEKIR